MKKFKSATLILLICVMLSTAMAPMALALDEPEVDANAIVLADANTGRVFFSRNEDMQVYPASLTKIMTVLLAVEAVENGTVSLTDMVTASENITYDLENDGSTAGILVGEIMTLEDLLYCAMLSSANEACNIIAEYIGGTIPQFVEQMNRRASELGCLYTHFANTHGLPNEDHYTTASDFALISREAISHSLFMQICDTATKTIPATNLSEARELSNTNGLINEDSYYQGYYYEYAAGVKTGHTSSAGYCLVSTAEKDGVHLVAVVMGAAEKDLGGGRIDYGSFSDSIALYEWVFNNFSYQEILKSSELVASVPVTMGADTDSVMLRPENSVTALLPNDLDSGSFNREITIYSEQNGETLEAPLEAGITLGEIKVTMNGEVYGTAPLVANSTVELSRMQFIKSEIAQVWSLTWVKVIFWLVILILVAYLALVIRYRILHARHVRSVRAARQARAAAAEEAYARRAFQTEETENEIHAQQLDSRRIPEPVPPRKMPTQEERDYFEEFFGQHKK
jgi:D-alanyl-D-alanine carboxypeptidase (penicillin-binding protein 5/6)